jgi:hypothetical protein
MRTSLLRAWSGYIVGAAIWATPAWAAGSQPAPTEREAIQQIARARAQSDLGKPLRLTSLHIGQQERWALVHAHMQAADGSDIDYAGTAYADAAARGHKSGSYVALLHKEQGHWTVVVDSVGPTDESWQAWGRQYNAPAALFDAP